MNFMFDSDLWLPHPSEPDFHVYHKVSITHSNWVFKFYLHCLSKDICCCHKIECFNTKSAFSIQSDSVCWFRSAYWFLSTMGTILCAQEICEIKLGQDSICYSLSFHLDNDRVTACTVFACEKCSNKQMIFWCFGRLGASLIACGKGRE